MKAVTVDEAKHLAILEEAEQRAFMAKEEASSLRDWLTKLIGQDSMEDQLQFGDGNRPEEDEDGA